jgi:endonuclease III
MQLFFYRTEGTIMAELTALAGVGSKNCYLMLELKKGAAS